MNLRKPIITLKSVITILFTLLLMMNSGCASFNEVDSGGYFSTGTTLSQSEHIIETGSNVKKSLLASPDNGFINGLPNKKAGAQPPL